MITKDKQYLLINIKDNKQYKINLNDLSVIGLRGNQLKRIPQQVKNELRSSNDKLVNTVFTLLNEQFINQKHKIELISCYEKLYAINKNVYFYHVDSITIGLINKNLKLVSAFIRERENVSMYEIKVQLERELLLKKHNFINRYFDHFNKNRVLEMGLFFSNKIANITNKELDSALSIYFFSGATDLFASYNVSSMIVKYIQLTKFFNVKIELKNWIKHCSVLMIEYKLEQEKNDNTLLKRNQDKKELFFENERYKVIVPITRDEFKKEGDAQNNCVYRLYLSRVIDGTTNIVFIRDKLDLESSLITCEVRDGQIIQFLKRFNSSNLTDDEKLFKKEYQQHLWGCADE